MSRRKISTTVYFDDHQAIALKAYTIKTGVPTAVFVRRAIAAALDQAFADGVIDGLDIERITVAPLGDRIASKAGDLEATVERVLRRLLEQPKPDAIPGLVSVIGKK